MAKVTLDLEKYELEALIQYHLDKEIDSASRQKYIDAENHVRRGRELREKLFQSSLPGDTATIKQD